MKKKITLITISIFVAILVTSVMTGQKAVSHSSGAPTGYSGSPGDGQDCTACHGGSASTVTGWITSNVPGAGYTPLASYTITVTVPGSGNKGFEVSPQNGSGTLLGTLTAGTGTKLVGSGKEITHNAVVTTNPAVWTFTWTAPASGTGDVTFYGAFAVTESVTDVSTLLVHENPSVGIKETTENGVSIYPNPVNNASQLNYFLESSSQVQINLYSLLGEKVATLFNGNQSSGNHSSLLNISKNISSGVYFIELKIDNKSTFRKIVVE